MSTNSLTVKGRVVHIDSEARTGTTKAGKEWKSQGFAIETNDEQYPKKIYAEASGNAVDSVGLLDIGIEVTVHMNIESREHNGKWYTSAKAYRIDS